MAKSENDLIEHLILDEIYNFNVNTSALIEYLAIKGIINKEDFFKFRDDFVKTLIKQKYPFLPVEHYHDPDDL